MINEIRLLANALCFIQQIEMKASQSFVSKMKQRKFDAS
jgi:hypothetical protein